MESGHVGKSTFNALSNRLGRLVLLAKGVLVVLMVIPVYGLPQRHYGEARHMPTDRRVPGMYRRMRLDDRIMLLRGAYGRLDGGIKKPGDGVRRRVLGICDYRREITIFSPAE
jgi:hypothetical protein